MYQQSPDVPAENAPLAVFKDLFSPDELKNFKINTHIPRFPQDNSDRKQFIFSVTGFAPAEQNMGTRAWYCFNYSMNKGLDLQLSDSTLKTLTLMDEALQHVPRFVGVQGIAGQLVDSTAAHSKQVMNIIEYVFEKSGVLDTRSRENKNEADTMRREALIGAWVHDMGEVIFELSTASGMFALSKAESTHLKQEKDALEDKIFTFACQLASKCIREGKPEEFISTIRSIRKEALTPNTTDDFALTDEMTQTPAMQRILKINQAIDRKMAEPDFPKEDSPETLQLRVLYDKTEGISHATTAAEIKKEKFFHAFVKTLESTEGQRYFQRNTFDSELQKLATALHPNHATHINTELLSDNNIVQAVCRCEKLLPVLFENASTLVEQKLAKAAASFVYRSIARQFLPEPQDKIGALPFMIDRNPQKKSYSSEQSLTPAVLREVRASEMQYKQLQYEKQDKDSYDVRYITREDMGAIYRAAEELVAIGEFVPQLQERKTACLINFEDMPEFPEALKKRAEEIKINPEKTANRMFAPTNEKKFRASVYSL